MTRRILIAVLTVLLAVPALAAGRKAYKSAGFTASAGLSKGLTFHAPFDDPANPLTIYKGTGTFTFTRVHDATHTATYVHPTTGLVTVADNNGLRIEANGALIEGARTNLALQSEVFKTTWAATTVTIVDDSTVAPDGTSTADQLQATGANSTLLQSVTGTVADYTFSVYLKRKDGTGAVQVRSDNTTWVACTINASTWTRCTDTRTLTVAAYTPGIRIVTSGDNVYAWGGQMEAGAFASSYIPTVAAAMTRNFDLLYFTATGNLSGTVGTVSMTVDTQEFSSPGIMIYTDATAYVVANWAGVLASYDGTELLSGPVWNTNASTRVAVSWDNTASECKLAKDGGAATVTGFDGLFTTGENISLGQGGGVSFMWGHLKDVRIWNRSFSDSELQAITQ
jgi:hypothetical protein